MERRLRRNRPAWFMSLYFTHVFAFRKKFSMRHCFLIPATIACIALNPAAAVDAPVFRAGAVTIDITPQTFPVSSAGSMTHRTASRAHDPLHARCLVLDDGTTQIAFAICDSCMIPREIFDAAKQQASVSTGIPVNHILASATHTHTAVTVAPTFQSQVQEDYVPWLTKRIAAGIEAAHSQLAPAQIGWSVGNNPRQVFNRRWHLRPGTALTDPFDRGSDRVRMNPPQAARSLLKPAGPIDPEVGVLAVQATDGTPIAVLANYSLHYVGGVPAGMLSADYFAEFSSQLTVLMEAASTDPPFVGIMSNGTSGDINNINFFEKTERQEPLGQIRLVAADVAESAFAALQRVEYHDWVPLQMRETEVEADVRRPDAAEIQRAQDIVDAAADRPLREIREIYAGETLDLAKYPPTVRFKLQAVSIGDLAIATTPCETFVETGLAIKQESPFRPTFTIELANGYNGYLPTPEQHALGGYETWRAKSSYLGTQTEPLVRQTLLDLLTQLHQAAAGDPR